MEILAVRPLPGDGHVRHVIHSIALAADLFKVWLYFWMCEELSERVTPRLFPAEHAVQVGARRAHLHNPFLHTPRLQHVHNRSLFRVREGCPIGNSHVAEGCGEDLVAPVGFHFGRDQPSLVCREGLAELHSTPGGGEACLLQLVHDVDRGQRQAPMLVDVLCDERVDIAVTNHVQCAAAHGRGRRGIEERDVVVDGCVDLVHLLAGQDALQHDVARRVEDELLALAHPSRVGHLSCSLAAS